MPLPEEVLRWYYKTELLLKERFDIDTTRKEDMGRIRAVQTKVLTLRDDPQKVESVKKAYLDEPDRKKKKEIRAKLTPSEMRPLAFGEELKSHQLPKTQIFFDESPYTVTEQFAFMKRSDDGQSYKTDIPEYEEGYHPWMLENQNTFHVKNVDGRLVMESSLSEDELMHIYQEAKDGRIWKSAK